MMDKNEKKIVENLDYMTEDVKVPDSLKPEAVEEMLKGHEVKKTKTFRKKRSYWKSIYSGAVAVAAVVLMLSGVIDFPRFSMALPSDQMDRYQNCVPERDFGKGVKDGVERIPHADSYEEVFEYLQEYRKHLKVSGGIGGMKYGARNDVREESAVEGASEDRGYSETNVRTEGIAEGDTVKTDGDYIYILKDTLAQLVVVDVRGNRMEEAGSIQFDRGTQVSEFYLEGDRLIALGTGYGKDGDVQEKTSVITYDISNPKKIGKVSEVTQSGYYDSSRIAGGYLYVFSNFYAEPECKVNETAGYIPEAGGRLIQEKDILLPFRREGCSYYVVSSIDLKKPEEIKESKGIFHNGGMVYVSGQNIYLCETDYDSANEVSTYIRKIAYKDGVLTGKAAEKVPGRLNNSFSLDEYEGYLRMAVTQDNAGDPIRPLLRELRKELGAKEDTQKGSEKISEENAETDRVPETIRRSNSVLVLDDSLKIVGRVDDLAEDEVIHSARFMGDTAYFVTYRQTDPLFSVDLSDPKNPKIIGTLKIPGFSDYLHPYGEGLLLGIGIDMDEEGVTSEGVKLSMFDISDPTDVKEIHKTVIKDVYSSPALNDYKAVLIDVEKNMIGFSGYGDMERYYMFSYDKKNGFRKCMEEEVNNTSWMTVKGLYIGERLYVVGGNIVEAYEIPSYRKTDDLILSHAPVISE